MGGYMKRFFFAGLLAVGGFANIAQAGVYTDDFSKCLVSSASADDQMALVQWIFSAMALHPGVKQYANISDAGRAAIDKKASALFSRLVTVDCHSQAVAALKYEGTSSLEAAFKVLGEVATRGIFSDPAVEKGMNGLASGLDMDALKKLFQEAGISKAK